MGLLILGLVLFLGVHSVAIIVPAWRDRMRARSGAAWKIGYSLISILGLVFIMQGFSLARRTPMVIYAPGVVLKSIALVLMLPVFPLLFAVYLPGRIKTAAKHPMLAAVKFWALAHLLANGLLLDLVFFGSFLVWAVLERISLKRRPPQLMTTLPPGPWNDAIALVLGFVVYGVTIGGLHSWLFGVAPVH
jgi:uncharacterized membrane protein